MDTRLLEKPSSPDGTSDSWRQSEFTFLGYAGAVDPGLKQAMIESEVLTETAITNAALPLRDQRVSTRLYHMLVLLLEGSAQRLLEHAGKGKGKAKDKDKEKDPAVNPDAEVICYRCHRKGHRKRDCRTVEKDKGKECENAVEQTPVQAAEANPVQSATPAWISMIELDEWILMVNIYDHEAQVGSIERVKVDSGAAVSVSQLPTVQAMRC